MNPGHDAGISVKIKNLYPVKSKGFNFFSRPTNSERFQRYWIAISNLVVGCGFPGYRPGFSKDQLDIGFYRLLDICLLFS